MHVSHLSLPSRNDTGQYPFSSTCFGNMAFTSTLVLLLGRRSAGGSSRGASGGTYCSGLAEKDTEFNSCPSPSFTSLVCAYDLYGTYNCYDVQVSGFITVSVSA